MRSALATWVGVVRECVKASVKYNYEHTQARAKVLPILDQIVRDADKIGCDRLRTKSTHWCDHVYVPPLGSREYWMDENFTMSGYTYKNYGLRIEEIVKRIYGYPWLALWLCG